MKKKILLLCFAFLSLFALQAQNPFFVSGYVTNLNGGAIANHTVFIMSDSNSMIPFSATTITNANGYYSFNNVTVPAPGLTAFFVVSTYDCNGVIHTATVSNANPQNTVNFAICNSTSSNCNAAFTFLFSGSNTVNFQDISTGTPVSWYWNFGDGTSSTLQNPSHSYNNGGYKNVCLTISTATCTSTYCDTIYIQSGTTNTCNAGFNFYPDSLAGLNAFHFINTSITTYLNHPVTYLWNFGDGTTSTQQNPVHTFALNPSGSATYNVCLTMKVMASNNTILCTSTICHPVSIGTSTNNCQNSFTYTHQNLNFAFSGQVNSTNPTTYIWNFGDGTTATGQNVTHTFLPPSSGTNGYHVCLVTITTNALTTCTDTSCQFITINNNTNTCNANFNAYPDSLAGPGVFNFINTSTSTYLNSQMLYLWNFGDGTTSTLQNPVHTYSVINPIGSYNVCLTIKVVNSIGTVLCQDNYCQSVIIGNNPNGCQNSFTFTHQNLNYNFTGMVNSLNPTTYTWNFGDGTSTSGQYVTHTFAQPAPGVNGYHVCLVTVSINNGVVCTDTSCQFITINNPSGNIIQGHVYAGNYPVSNGYVLLYQANNATMSYNLIDTLALDSSGYYQYNYLAVPPVNPAFLLKAVLNSTSTLFNQYAPTFYVHTFNWFAATPVFPSASSVYFNINMIQLPINPITGNGSLNGNIVLLGTKSSGTQPLSDVELIVTDENDSPLKIKYSDVNGNFSFTNLAMGNYKLHVEIAGINYTPYPVMLNTSNPSVSNITITVNNNAAVITGISDEINRKSSISEIYPNPATSEAFIDIKNSKADKIVISIFDNTGIKLSSDTYNISGNQRINLNKKQLPTGIYTVKIETSNGLNSVRKLVISK